VALGTVKAFLESGPGTLEEVRVVLFSERDLAVYADALARI
jgi:hypothetical protein